MVDFGLRRLDVASGTLGKDYVWPSDYVGNKDAKTPKKALLINFYATWCEPCKAELPVLLAIQKKHGANGLQIVSVNFHFEDEEIGAILKESAALAKKHGLTFPILIDRLTHRNQIISWTTTDPQVISRLFFGDQQTLNFAVTPTAPNGTGTGEVSVDYVEVVVKYRQP